MSADVHPVVVVGGGPVGLTAAIQLAQLGVPVVVLERWDDVYPLPRAIAMDDEVQRILARLGLEGELAEMTREADGLQLMDRTHRVLARFDRTGIAERSGFSRAVMFHQPLYEGLLREHAATFPGISLRTGVEVTSIEQSGPGPATVRMGDEEIRAEFVLGCDGANSLTRRTIGATMEDLRFEQRWLVLDVDTDADLGQWGGVHQVCDPYRAATFMQGNSATRYRWEFRLLDGEVVDRDFATVDQLLPLIGPWTGDTPAAAMELSRTTEYTFRAQLADRWRDRRLFILGDAAHLTPPFIGQGMGAGLRDAANLTWKIAGVLDGSLPADVLDSYETERKPHARSLIKLARLTGQVMTGGGRFGDLLRRALVPAMSHAPGIRAQVLDSETPALTANPWIDGGALAGTIAHNVPIDDGRLDGLIGGRWALVTTRPPSPSDRELLASRGVVVVEDLPEVGGWLGDEAAALVRPDGAVMSSGRVSDLCGTVGARLRPATTVVAP